jgi:amino acid transporter
MKTLTFFIIASIGMLTTSITIMVICLVLVGYLFYRYEIKKKPQKVERSQSAFESVANKKCECENPCNKYCHNERISS